MSENNCPKCGATTKPPKIDGHYIIHEIEHILHFEKGFLYTIKALLTQPGESIRAFIADNRTRFVKPITFIIVTSLVYTVISHFFGIDEFFIKFSSKEGSEMVNSPMKLIDWSRKNYGYTNIFSGALIAVWLKVFFKKYEYNFFELLVMLCYVMGISVLIKGVFVVFQGFTGLKVYDIGQILGIIYAVIAIGSFFDKEKKINFVKALVSYVLGFTAFILIVICIGIAYDFITKR